MKKANALPDFYSSTSMVTVATLEPISLLRALERL
jgi:hypothetical protein